MAEKVHVDFWFDPSCPYTWITSRWLIEVTAVRPVEVRWRVMSLSVLNEGRDDNPEGEVGDSLWRPVRVCAAVEQQLGSEALGRFFTGMGEVLQNGDWGNMEAQALAAADLPVELAEVAGSTEYDDVVRASHAEAMNLVGPDVGSPVIAVPGPDGERVAFFGPVVSPTPRGELAARLWDGLLLVAGVPGFAEIKRTRLGEPDFS